MDKIKNWLWRLWLKIGEMLNSEYAQDLIILAVDRLITKDVKEELVSAIIIVSSMDKSGAEKKALVVKHIRKMEGSIRKNLEGVSREALSMAINLLVEYLQSRKEIPHK